MTVFELLAAILKQYPGASADALGSFKPVFYSRLEKHEGERLAGAANEVFATFRPTARQPFPIPVDFEQHLPNLHRDLGSVGPAIDLKAHGECKRALMAEWRKAQGERGANGVPQVMSALEFIAEQLASVAAWRPNPPPLRLTAQHLRLAQHRAVSLQRRVEFGPITHTTKAEEWWAQISAILTRWGIPAIRAEWETATKAEAKEAA